MAGYKSKITPKGVQNDLAERFNRAAREGGGIKAGDQEKRARKLAESKIQEAMQPDSYRPDPVVQRRIQDAKAQNARLQSARRARDFDKKYMGGS